jgi:hypothetical protein
VVEFFTLKISADRNDVLHNATGLAVGFGRTCNPATTPETPNLHPDTIPPTMSNRYKIFQVERSQFGLLPGGARIVLSPNTISFVLSDELQCAGGSTTFGVECDTFAWFEDGPFITLILREEDPHFNIDLAMTQLANLPGKEGIDFFELIEARITRRKCPLDSILRGRGLRPISAGGALPHQGMGGTVYRGGGADPVFAAPPLPKLVGQPGDSDFDGLIDLWFRQLQAILVKLKERFGSIKLVLHGGGTVPVPDWFKDWCAVQGIEIEFADGQDFKSNLEPPSDNERFSLQPEPFQKLQAASHRFSGQAAVGRSPTVYILDGLPKEDLDNIPEVSSGKLPAQLAHEVLEIIRKMGINPDAPLTRDQVRAICSNNKVGAFQAYAVVMAWGGQRMSHFRSSANDSHLLDLVKQLRTSKLSRSEDFERCRVACAGIKGLGISFFSKLLYFLRPKTDAYILDQWIAKSLSVLFHPSPVRMAPWGGPHPMTTATEYDACCEAIEQLGLKLGGWRGDQVEQLLFDRPRGKWRTYVTNCLAGATDEELAEFETTEASPCDDTHSCLPCILAEIVAAMHREAAEGGSKIPAFTDPSVQHSCQRTSPCRVYCGTEDGREWYYHINQASVRVGVFIPRRLKDAHRKLRKRGEEIDSGFWDGITISDSGDTCSISINVSGGSNSPLNEFPDIADRAVVAMEKLYRQLSRIWARL